MKTGWLQWGCSYCKNEGDNRSRQNFGVQHQREILVLTLQRLKLNVWFRLSGLECVVFSNVPLMFVERRNSAVYDSV
jgi:hypothetical protein